MQKEFCISSVPLKIWWNDPTLIPTLLAIFKTVKELFPRTLMIWKLSCDLNNIVHSWDHILFFKLFNRHFLIVSFCFHFSRCIKPKLIERTNGGLVYKSAAVHFLCYVNTYVIWPVIVRVCNVHGECHKYKNGLLLLISTASWRGIKKRLVSGTNRYTCDSRCPGWWLHR